MLSSTFSLPILTLPAYSSARMSMVGPSILHGPHHSAQKSTITGTFDCKTSLSKLLSLNVTTFLPAMLPPDLDRPISIGHVLLDYQRPEKSQRGINRW